MRLVEAGAWQQTGPPGWATRLWAFVWAARVPLAFASVVLAAAVVRGWGLGAKSLWFDETYSVFIAQQPFTEIPRLLRNYDTHPPLYYLLLHFWMVLFGKSEAVVRLPSLLASLGVVALTLLLGRRLAGDRVGILAAAFIALSPFQVVSAQEARMYPFLTLFGLGATYALWRALEEGGRRYWITYVVLILLALYAHHFAFLLVLAHGAYLLVAERRRPALRSWALAMVAVAIGYLPLLPALLSQFQTARTWPNVRPPFGIVALTDTLGLLSFGGGLFGMGTYFYRGTLALEYRTPILLPFVLLAFWGAVRLPPRRRLFLLGYWLLPVLVMAAISLRWNLFYERYFSFVLPPFAVLLAAGVFHLADVAQRSQRVAVLAGTLALLVSFNVPALVDIYRTQPTYDWRGAARHVMVQARPDDFIMLIPAFARIPFEYYFPGTQARMALNPRELLTAEQAVAPGYQGLRNSIEPERVAQIARTYPRLWIVATIPIGYDARVRIGKILDPYFRAIEGGTFGRAVFVFLWESRLYRQPIGRW